MKLLTVTKAVKLAVKLANLKNYIRYGKIAKYKVIEQHRFSMERHFVHIIAKNRTLGPVT